jgi:hypothetical protein
MVERASRPQKVEIDKEQIQSILQDISKYLGVAPTKPATQQPQQQERPVLSPAQKKRQKRKEKAQQNDDEEDVFENPKNYIIHPNYRDDLIKIIKQNSSKLKVNKDGNLIDASDQTVKDSHVNDIVDYLTGIENKKPAGADTSSIHKRMKNFVE